MPIPKVDVKASSSSAAARRAISSLTKAWFAPLSIGALAHGPLLDVLNQ